MLLGKGGLRGQTIRFAPPMNIMKADAGFLLAVLDEAIGALSLAPGSIYGGGSFWIEKLV